MKRAIDEQGNHGSEDRADHPGRLECALVEVVAEEDVAEDAADEAADDPEQGGLPEGHRVGPRNQQPRQIAGYDTDYE